MKITGYKKYLAGALVLIGCFLVFRAGTALAQTSPFSGGGTGLPSPGTPVSNPFAGGGTGISNPAAPATPVATPASGGSALSQAQNAAVKSLNWYSCATNFFTCSIYGISNLINYFLNLLVTLGAIIINVGIFLDGQVFNSPTVQAGFSVSLAIANLGFVLGIIVIALATILRNETYGIKQMLWKLVVMAILVNFGLVICGPIVGLADNFTQYFLTASGGSSNFSNALTHTL